jgi:hypothetical protein
LTFQELGSLGEFIAAIATLITLVFLAFQIRQNTKISRAQLTKDLFLASRSALLEIARDRDLARIAAESYWWKRARETEYHGDFAARVDSIIAEMRGAT